MNYHIALRAFERDYWERMLVEHKTVAAAAEAAGIRRTSVYRIVERAGIHLPRNSRYGNRGNWGSL